MLSTDHARLAAMRHIVCAATLTLLLAGSAFAQMPPRINCKAPHQLSLDLAPVGAGPLMLAQVYCQTMPHLSLLSLALALSPDGRSLAHYHDNGSVLRVAPLDGSKGWTEYQAPLGTFKQFSSNIRSALAFAWASDSQSVWTGTHERLRPSGFATSPLRAVRTMADGALQTFPDLQHSAGPLDALLWANGDGLALAQFGTRGGLYRPEHDDPTPTFAIVDAQRGRVLDSLPFEAIEPAGRRRPGAAAYAAVQNAAVTTLPDGRVRALLSVGQWAVWTQGETPRVIPDPYPREFHSRMVLSPDGASVLVGRLLRTSGGYCIEPRGCFPGTPVEGVLAALHDLATGRELWAIRATAVNDFEFPTSAISPDGRYALIGLMPGPLSAGKVNIAGAIEASIALVAMDNGAIVQTFPAPGPAYAMGFARGGRTVWAHAYGLTALYDLR
jgi:hypothetical protein